MQEETIGTYDDYKDAAKDYETGGKEDLEFDVGMLIKSNNEDEWASDEEVLDNGASNPYNVKFKVNVDGEDVFGIWRIFREFKPELTRPYVKKKIETIAREDAKMNKALQDLEQNYEREEKDGGIVDPDGSFKEKGDEIRLKRDNALQELYKDECLYLSENDREKLGINNIILFSPWRNKRQQENKAPKTVKSADGQKLKVTKKDKNRTLFPEVYKLILTDVAAGLMVPVDESYSGDDEKES